MLKDHSQLQLSLSPYQGLYDAIIPKDHLLRRIKENIDFSFVNPMLRKQYCENFGRPAKEPEMMFKLLFLKKLYDLSDEALISSAQTDMAYKFFLNLEPEAKMIDPSLLTKFRKTRITEDILEELLKETIQQALDKNLIKSGTIIVERHIVANKNIKLNPIKIPWFHHIKPRDLLSFEYKLQTLPMLSIVKSLILSDNSSPQFPF